MSYQKPYRAFFAQSWAVILGLKLFKMESDNVLSAVLRAN